MSSRKLLSLGWLLTLLAVTAFAQSTAFTHQGRLTDNGAAANGLYDLQFALFDALSGGAQQGATITRDDVPVTNGVFTVQLDFGATPFNGAARWLQISVRNGASTGVFTLLNPRQPLSATPYALRSQSAAAADNATQLGGVAASQYVQTADTRLTDARTPTAGSTNYIQNTTTPQAASNFNISGDGTAGGTLSGNVVNAATQFNLDGNRVLAVSGIGSNIFAGVGAGANTPTFIGFNAFVGANAGQSNITGSHNAFVGNQSGAANTVGALNAFVGDQAGLSNTTGSNNTLLGGRANVGSSGLSFATAIGAGTTVYASNTIQLGSQGEIVRTSGPILSGGLISLERNRLLLKNSNDTNHAIQYNSVIDGIEFDAYTGFTWIRTNGGLTQMTLNNNGVLYARGGFNGRCVGTFFGDGYCNQDLAETFRTKEQTEAGDVVTLIPQDHERPTVRRSLHAYDEHLVGVVSSNPGLVFDEGDTKLAGENDHYITKDKTVVAAVGRVPVKFTLENGAINVGDPLTSSATEPGKAMKATGAGKIIGIALESSAKAKDGKLLLWLQLGYHAPVTAALAQRRKATGRLPAEQPLPGAEKGQRLKALEVENATLKAQMNAVLERLAQLENAGGKAGAPQP